MYNHNPKGYQGLATDRAGINLPDFGGVVMHKFVNDDFLTNSNDRFITYTPDLDTLNWKDPQIRKEFEENPELWF